jgi:hypothetical protein
MSDLSKLNKKKKKSPEESKAVVSGSNKQSKTGSAATKVRRAMQNALRDSRAHPNSKGNTLHEKTGGSKS